MNRRHLLHTALTGTAFSQLTAAGVIAALAALSQRPPHEIPWPEAEAKLKAMGARR